MMRWVLGLAAALLSVAAPAAAQDDVIAIDVLIQPDAATVAKAQATNARLRQRDPSGYALDASHAPHVTLAQRFVHRADLPRIQAAVAKVIKRDKASTLKMEATGYNAVSFGGTGLLMLDFARTPALTKLQQDVVDAVQPFAVSGGTGAAFVQDPSGPIVQGTIDWVEHFVPNASGEKFGPHVTVGVGPVDFLREIAAEPFAKFTSQPAGIAIFQLGNFGTARTLLWASPVVRH